MGYMGFGMRKEVYKRKPKKAFKRLKEIYRNNLNFPNSGIKGKRPKIFLSRTPYKHFGQTNIVKAIRFIIVVSIFGILIWIIVAFVWDSYFEKKYFNFQRDKFERTELPELIENEFGELRSITDYLLERGDKINSISPAHKDDFTITIKHLYGMENISRDSVSIINLTGIHNAKFDILDSKLIVGGFLEKDRWQLSLISFNSDSLTSSFFEFLNTDKNEFKKTTMIVNKIGYPIKVGKSMIVTLFSHHEFGTYQIILSNKSIDNLLSMSKAKFEHIEEGLYWQRK